MENFYKNKNAEGYTDYTACKAIKNIDGGGVYYGNQKR